MHIYSLKVESVTMNLQKEKRKNFDVQYQVQLVSKQ